MNALVMYDRETDSLWSQFLGEAVEGPLAGTKLRLVSSQLISWAAWREEHPDTLVLDTSASGPIFDSYYSYYLSGSAGILGESHTDDRLSTKELVVGVEGETSQRAYAYRHLADSSVVNDTFEGRHLLVTLNVDSGAAAVFDRSLDGRTLTFEEADSPLLMTDGETGSTWNKTTGKAVSGPLEGKELQKAPFLASFWFAWTDFHPDTELYEG